MSAIETRISRFEAALLTALFVALIALPLCKQFLIGEPDTKAVEGRLLNERPQLSLAKNMHDFSENFEAYYNDHFGFRAVLLHMGAYLGVKYANVSLSSDVIIGKEGWLFRRNGLSQEYYHGGAIVSDEALEQWAGYVEGRQRWLAQRGIRYLFVVPADKQTIYPEYMPDKYTHLHEQTLAEQVLGYLATHSSAHLLSLAGPLSNAKGDGRLYYRADFHWNSQGAYVGYQTIMNRLHEWFPDLKPKDRSEFQIVMQFHKGDLARLMGMPDYSAEDEPVLKPVFAPMVTRTPFKVEGVPLSEQLDYALQTADARSARRLVMKHDSYADLLVPYMAADFARITCLGTPFDDVKSERALAEAVQRDKPDIFIDEILERSLLNPPRDPKVIFGGE